jgi:hypothetical protein
MNFILAQMVATVALHTVEEQCRPDASVPPLIHRIPSPVHIHFFTSHLA